MLVGSVIRAALVCLLALAVTGCGATVSGIATRQGTPLEGLDYGNYQIVPRALGNAGYDVQARTRESQRLGDYVAVPFEIDPGYTKECTGGLRPHVVVNRKGLGDLVVNDTFDDVAADLRAGWVNTWCTDENADKKYVTLNLAVLQFPDAATAARVGPALEHDDFTYNIDNRSVTLPNYADARAHWRPAVNSVGVWMVHERFVVFVKITDTTTGPDLTALTTRAERALHTQLPLLDQYRPTPDTEFARISLDPEGLLGRTLPSDPQAAFRRDVDGVFTGRGALMALNTDSLGFLTEGEIDQIAIGQTSVFRSRTAKGALAMWNSWQQTSGIFAPNQRVLDPPKGVGEHITCFENASIDGTTSGLKQCNLHVDRYNVAFGSRSQEQLYQQVVAQYVLLTSPLAPVADTASTASGTPQPGPFPSSPSDFQPEYDDVNDVYNVEARRMMSYLADPYQIDPELTQLGQVGIIEPNSISFGSYGVLPEAWLPVMERNRLICGALTVRSNGSLRRTKNMSIAVLRFPNEQAARAVVDELDSSAAAKPDRKRLPTDDPAVRAISAGDAKGQVYASTGTYVVIGQATIAESDPVALTNRLTTLVRTQFEAMRKLTPTPLSSIVELPQDRDGMMRLTLPKTKDTELADRLHPQQYGIYDAAAWLHFERDSGRMRKAFEDSGVDFVANRVGMVYRTRDEAAAIRLREALTTLTRNDEIIGSPPGISDARCVKLYDDSPVRKQDLLCAMVYDRYVAVIGGESGARGKIPQTFPQQVAAQYSILTKAK